MLDAGLIRKLFLALDRRLGEQGVIGEIGLCGGAVMCLVFQTRKATRDVDAIFEPTREIRRAARSVARDFKLPDDWLNDAATGFFFSEPPRIPVLDLPHLRIWSPGPEYMLAMKCYSARFDSHDREDVAFLIRHLGLKRPADVFAVVRTYVPESRIPAKTRFMVEELLSGEDPAAPH